MNQLVNNLVCAKCPSTCISEVEKNAVRIRAKRQYSFSTGAALKQKEVVKAIFVNNIAQLGHHYARVFQDAR